MSEAIKTLVEYAPFGAFCLIFLFIQYRFSAKALDKIEKAFEKSLENIRESNNKSLEILKDAQNIAITEKMKER